MNTNLINSVANDVYQTSDAYRKDKVSQTDASPAKTKKAEKTSDTTKENKAATAGKASETEKEKAAVYDKNAFGVYDKKSKKNNYITLNKENKAIVDRLKEEAEQRTSQLRSLVENMILKQNASFNTASLTDKKMYEMLRKGQLEVDPEVVEQAKKDISEDGYWGVKQTSDRLFSFAKAISGGDTSKLESLISAMENGFKQATKSWGDELPDICQKTLDAAKEKLRLWAKETDISNDKAADSVAKEFEKQAADAALADSDK